MSLYGISWFEAIAATLVVFVLTVVCCVMIDSLLSRQAPHAQKGERDSAMEKAA